MRFLLGKCFWLGNGIQYWFFRQNSNQMTPVLEIVLRPGLHSVLPLANSGPLDITLHMTLSHTFCKMGAELLGK